MAVYDRNAGTWLHSDGTWGAWQQRPATLANPGATNTALTLGFTAPAPGLYAVQAEAVDTSGNLAAARTWVTFEYRQPDTTAPSQTVSAPSMEDRKSVV